MPPIVPSSAEAPPTPPKIDTDIADTGDDVAVLVPPTPTKLLPISETDGLTSGAVQPPGSTGDENKQEVRVTVSEPEDDESDGNSFEDEPFADAEQTAEWEDDEQRLIRQGGSGIPIGPVCRSYLQLPRLIPHSAATICRTAAHSPCSLPSRVST